MTTGAMHDPGKRTREGYEGRDSVRSARACYSGKFDAAACGTDDKICGSPAISDA